MPQPNPDKAGRWFVAIVIIGALVVLALTFFAMGWSVRYE